MQDGYVIHQWRLIGRAPEAVSWVRLRRHLEVMPGGLMVDVVCDRMNEAALILEFSDYRFAAELGEGEFRFSVQPADCPDQVVREVVEYVRRLIGGARVVN